ncbi:fibrinogen-binding protein [Rhizobium sp. J15]|uniref:fibrinogen-binding protein n=1 Tax=Rhizobium sp. J15 TaxID=2035450 RepID=UPI000BEA800F|nr:fibrinogen-binding protein [Rhizobium sp. J15]PDT14286.1 fibrinogen-binding protein [Rhizobium sp. J15]
MSDVYKHDKIGALADGFANSAVNSTEVDDGATGYVGVANGDNRDNQDNSQDNSVDVDVKAEISANNGDNRDNDYDWSYDSDDDTKTITDTDTKTITDTDTKTITDTDTKTITDTDTKTITDTDTKTITDTDTKTVTDSYNTSDSFNKTDTDFAVLEDVKDFDNLGIAGGDLTFNLGDDFSFTLDVDSILNNSLGGAGNDSGFSAVQANHLADQDDAWNVRMDNAGANNNLNSNGGTADSAEGMEMDGRGWDLKAGDDASGSSAADASAILANSGFHLEFVQGANLLSNTVDSSVIGGNSHVSDVGEDTGT